MSRDSHVSAHAIERSIRKLDTGGVLDLDLRRALGGYDQLQEIETQIQVAIWGTAHNTAAWSTFNVVFDVQFVFTPEQRDSPLAVPHFTYGPVASGVPFPEGTAADPNNPDSLVAVCCQVVEWGRDLNTDTIIGAVIGIGVDNRGNSVDIAFNGYVHLTFQGYGAVTESSVSVGGTSG